MNFQMRGGPLQGVRVIELTKVWAGPYAGKLLAFLGAEVIRVESEKSLDVTRSYGVSDINDAPGFKAVNPQKLSVQIDMKSKEGIELILSLAQKSDVLIENLRPGAVKRLGLDYETVKKTKNNIIYTSMGMYGSDGPLSYQTGYAPCFAALSGLSSLVGYEGQSPSGMNVRYADSTFGATAALAILASLFHRRRTGEGQYIDVSAVESMTSMIGDSVIDYMINGKPPVCRGNRNPDMAPHGVYPCLENEWISIAAATERAWHRLAETMGCPELSRHTQFNTLKNRKQNEDALDTLIANWTRHQKAESLATQLQANGIAAFKSSNSIDLLTDEHLWKRGFYHEVTDANGATRSIVGPGWKMSRGASITDGAPYLGEHNAYVLGEIIGLSTEEQNRLTDKGVLR